MLEIPVNTCNITYKPVKKKRVRGRKKIDNEQVKQELMDRVNNSVLDQSEQEVGEPNSQLENTFSLQDSEQSLLEEREIPVVEENIVGKDKKPKTKRSPLIIFQIAVICILLATIVVSNIVNTNSGLTAFFRGVFTNNATSVAVDERVYSDFKPVISMDGLSSEQADGVMTFAGEGNVYSAVDGVVKSVFLEADGTYTVEVAHSENFLSVFKGLTYAYAEVGNKVFSNIPVGYFEEQLSLCFCSEDGSVISDYQVVDGYVVWSV